MAAKAPQLNNHTGGDDLSADGEKSSIHQYERAINENGVFTAEELQGRFDLLRDLSTDEMTTLNKKVLSKLDWRLMPTITIMFLLKYVFAIS